MLESFMVAFNAVGPFLILLGIGFAAVRLKLTDRPFMDRLNALNYRLFFPFLMFNNVYSAKPENMPSVKLMLTGSLSVILLVVLLVIIVPKIVKENPRRGVVIQGIFRSNFIIYGIPLTTYVFGTEKSSSAGLRCRAALLPAANHAALLHCYAGVFTGRCGNDHCPGGAWRKPEV